MCQSCPTLCNPMDCGPPASSVHGIFQARTMGWVAMSSPGDLPDPGIHPDSLVSCTGGWVLYPPLGKPVNLGRTVAGTNQVVPVGIPRTFTPNLTERISWMVRQPARSAPPPTPTPSPITSFSALCDLAFQPPCVHMELTDIEVCLGNLP